MLLLVGPAEILQVLLVVASCERKNNGTTRCVYVFHFVFKSASTLFAIHPLLLAGGFWSISDPHSVPTRSPIMSTLWLRLVVVEWSWNGHNTGELIFPPKRHRIGLDAETDRHLVWLRCLSLAVSVLSTCNYYYSCICCTKTATDRDTGKPKPKTTFKFSSFRNPTFGIFLTKFGQGGHLLLFVLLGISSIIDGWNHPPAPGK